MEPVDHGGEGLGVCAVVSFAALAAMPYEPGSLEHGEMFGDGGLRDARIECQGVDSQFSLPG